ncbi:hypothetical protein N8203_03330 [Crocinitomicaceae bacterium]|nr:hypothetical protein [Crocinitomicaceae bacterium]
MKKTVLFLILIFSIQISFAKSHNSLISESNSNENPYFFLVSNVNQKLDVNEAMVWPRKRRGCHGGKKQKRRNKRRIKRSRKS